jgi:ADP-ribosyl-[dinitrogen reductase] hydrolase
MRTSLTHPLQIATVPVLGTPGFLGLTFCPGKRDAAAEWQRDLDADLAVIRDWGADVVVTLVEAEELELLAVTGLEAAVARHGMQWLHLPIRDVSVPDAAFEQQWQATGAKLRATLRRGGRLLVHCRGGLGRAGMISARILVEFGMPAAAAIAAIRRARSPSAIETIEQENHVRSCRLVTDDI